MHRRALPILAAVLLLTSAGCVSVALGDTLEMSASPAAVEDDALTETDFAVSEYRQLHIDESVDVATTERQVNATSHVVVYDRTTDLSRYDDDTGALAVISTPDLTVAGQSMNPAARMSHRELVGEFEGEIEDELGQIGPLTLDHSRTEPVLGRAANVTTFETETTIEGERVTLELHVTTVRHEGDLVVAIGGHPEALQQQAPAIHRLLRGIEHPVEESSLGG